MAGTLLIRLINNSAVELPFDSFFRGENRRKIDDSFGWSSAWRMAIN